MMKAELSISEAALLVQRSRATVYRWIDEGLLVPFDTAEGLKVRSVDLLAVAGRARRGRPRRVG